MKGSKMLNWILVQCTHEYSQALHQLIYNAALHNRIKAEKGSNKVAIMAAAARKMMCVIYVMLKEERSFRLDG